MMKYYVIMIFKTFVSTIFQWKISFDEIAFEINITIMFFLGVYNIIITLPLPLADRTTTAGVFVGQKPNKNRVFEAAGPRSPPAGLIRSTKNLGHELGGQSHPATPPGFG